jgi:uncharacterized tellurite resistance protein B-like protein
MNATQTRVVRAVELIQTERDEILALLAAVAAADTGLDEDGDHVVHLPASVMAGIRNRLS